MSSLVVGVVRETGGDRRVALDPKAVVALVARPGAVLVECGAGVSASFMDTAYGAVVTSRRAVISDCDVLAVVRPPDHTMVDALHQGQVLIGLLDPFNNPGMVQALAEGA